MVSTLSMIFMGISAVISIGLPIGLFLILRKKYGLKVVPMLVGAAAFIVFALVLEQQLHMLVLRPDANGVIELKNNPLLYVLYGIFAAGIFEESARYLSFLLLKRRYKGVGTGLSYGIGHGGVEAVLLAGVSMISNLIVSIMINSETAGSLGIQAAQLTALTDTAPHLFLISGFERILAVIIQISLSLLVWFAVDRKDKWWLFLAAIVLHAIIDIPAALMQAGVTTSIFWTESIIAVSALAVAMIAVSVCRSLKRSDKIL